MNVQEAYKQWSAQYDTNINRTRDLEALALRKTLKDIPFSGCLEIGCGTGKNTVWLAEHSANLSSVDLSPEMLAVAKEKRYQGYVEFIQADITVPWVFRKKQYGLVCFSLVLEHVEKLEPIFREATAALEAGGSVYVGELHPFKQYSGSKARFETPEGIQTVQCFTHHISDFIKAAYACGLFIVSVGEFFDDDGACEIPRILTLLFKKR